ncbi:hypothetical protein G9C85_04720 [Halorubellus sp. JP-L1]|uniref:hypothetical protein n=1 Tax=Halorubellus sp. JP-L1 TaxID=2715753 RepID=UPI00140DB464|nr:hypothetical protein [Halorubellus sp. JP-L1]NHN40939.1 hypothetical protein [Halorubellus sp. JP-L1]
MKGENLRRLRVLFVVVLVTVSMVAPVLAMETDQANQPTENPAPSAATLDAAFEAMEGFGTADDPYVVTNLTQLQAMDEDRSAHYALGNDIDATPTEEWNYGGGFEPISTTKDPFTGSFDGRNHTITGLYIDRPSARFVGLIANTEGSGTVLENVQIVDATVTGEGYVGILVGWGDDSIEYVDVQGRVDGEDYVGGVAGFASSIRYSSANVHAEGTEYVGGLVGSASEVIGSYAIGSVTAQKWSGGLAGSVDPYEDDEVVRNYAAVSVSVSEEYRAGAFAGQQRGEFKANYWNPSVSGQSDGAVDLDGDEVVTELSATEMQGANARQNMRLPWGDVFVATDEYPVHRLQIESLDLEPGTNQLVTGNETAATVTLTLESGRTVTATAPAEFETNNSLASTSQGAIAAGTDNGTVNVTASLAGFSDSATVDIVHPADVDVTSVDAPTAVLNDSTAAIAFEARNEGGASGVRTVSLNATDGSIAATQVSVDGYERANASFAWTPTKTGDYDLAVGSADAGTVTVVDRDSVTLTGANAPENVAAGASYEVELAIENDADVAVAVPVTHVVDGERVTEQVTAAPGSTTVTVSAMADADAGTSRTHAFSSVNGTANATTNVVEPAKIGIESTSVPSAIVAGESGSFSVTVANTGGVATTTPVTVTVGGEVVVEESVTLDPGASTTVSGSTAVESAGSASVEMTAGNASQTAELSVSEPRTTTTSGDGGTSGGSTTAADSSDDGDSGSGGSPGFGIVVAALALVVVAFRRR